MVTVVMMEEMRLDAWDEKSNDWDDVDETKQEVV